MNAVNQEQRKVEDEPPEDENNAMNISQMVDTTLRLKRFSRDDTGEVIETRMRVRRTKHITP